MHRVSLKRWVARSSVLLCTASAAWSLPCTASAQGSTRTADPEVLKHAREQFAQALALQTGGDWAGALALLKEVAAIKPTPQVRFNVALCEERLGRLVAALGDYELAGSDAQSEKTDQVRQEVDSRLEALRARVPRVVVQRGEGAESATISIDGVLLGDSVVNTPLPVDPGPHVVEATALGYQPFKQSFRVVEQQTATIAIALQATPVKPEPLAATPSRTGSGSGSGSGSSLRTAGFVIGGVGIASLITSGAMFYLRHTTISDLDKQCGPNRDACPDSSHSDVDRGKLYTSIGDVTLIAGAVGVGVGAALIIVGNRESEQPSVALSAGAFGANLGGATLLGRF